jgi:hypothetical protein
MLARCPTHPIPLNSIVTTLSEELAARYGAFDCAICCILPSLPPSYAQITYWCTVMKYSQEPSCINV